MNITRDNYELFFLMYVDNELPAAEKAAVELFLKENEDLRAELELLQQTTLIPEENIFVPKTQLYKNATQVESVQESLLLHLDNELSSTDAATVENQISSDEQVEAEWLILQKTKLNPKEKIVFTNKRSLYRHSNNVVGFRVWRVAAAILIGLAIFTGLSIYNKEIQKDGVAKNAGKQNNNPQIKVLPVPAIPIPFEKENESLVKSEENIAAEQNNITVQVSENIVANKIAKVNDKNAQSPVLTNINTEPGNNTVKQNVQDKREVEPTKLNRNKEEQILITQEDVAVNPSLKIKEINQPVIDTDINDVKQSFASLVANNETESNDRILFMDEDKVGRSKIGGLFKKVKRVVERNTKIKTSNGFRIGGFEFAVK